jgi:hypothetical protein
MNSNASMNGSTARQHLCARQTQVVIGRPDLPNFVLLHERETGSIHVSELGAAKAIEDAKQLPMVGEVDAEDTKAFEILDQRAQRACALFAVTM